MGTLGRRTISIIMSVIMVLSCFAGMTFSVGAETSGDYEYELLDDGTVCITKYNGSDADVTIPSEIDGKKVTVVGWDAFNRCTGLTSVSMQDGIICVGERAFQGCSNLVSVEMQDSDSLITIGMIAFEGCGFKELTIPEGVESLGYFAVGHCENLESITLPKSLKFLGERALCGDISLKEINIPEKLWNIGYGAFEGCTSLESYNVSENNETFTSVDGVIFSKDMKTLILYPEGRKDAEYTIPDGVEKIQYVGDYPGALNSQNLEKVIIPESVTEIPDNAIGYYSTEDEYDIKKEGFVVVGKLGSAAEKYAYGNDFEFINIEKQDCTHTESEIKNTKSATCTENGYTGDEVCTLCGVTIEKGSDIPALGHSFENYISDNNATCAADGTKTAKCERCDMTDTVQDVGTIKPHTAVKDDAVAPTCTEKGLTEGLHCSVCGTVLTAQTEIRALGHNFENGRCTRCSVEEDSSMKDMIASMSVGDTFTFGSYPQTDVTSELGAQLTAAAPSTDEWSSYNYYYGGEQSDYMKYYDLMYDEEMYRGVYFTKYRPYYWTYTSDGEQDDNGYYTNNIYWFRYDPLTWRILDPSTGYVICENIIDSQAFNNEYYSNGTEDSYGYTAYYNDKTYTHYANNWEYSTIRTWLNETFFVTAFSMSERNQIPCTKHTTPAYSTSRSDYDVGETGDYIFLPTYQDMTNSSYDFSSSCSSYDINRRAHASDYAKSQGVYVSTYYTDKDGNYTSYYRLRSAGYYSNRTTEVNYYGNVNNDWDTYDTYYGIRPALCFNPSSTVPTHVHTQVKIEGRAATCTQKGLTDGVKCSVCGEILTPQTEIAMLEHTRVKIAGRAATCTQTGLTDGVKCSVCGTVLTAQRTTAKLEHRYVSGKCAVCSASDPNYKPAETTTAKPSETTTAKPAETTTVKAAETTTENTSETTTAKPAETTTAKPAETTTEKPAETTTAKQVETTTVKSAETTTAKSAETTTAKQAETTAEIAETTTAKTAETTTAKPTEVTTAKPSEATTAKPTEPTSKAAEKLEFAENAEVEGKIDEENKKVSILPKESKGITLDDFKAMFKSAVSVAGEKIDKVFNGMKFIFNGNEYTFIIKGDTKADGKITAADARMMLRIAARLEQPDDVTKESADIDSDSKVTGKEARSVLRFAARLQSKIYE